MTDIECRRCDDTGYTIRGKFCSCRNGQEAKNDAEQEAPARTMGRYTVKHVTADNAEAWDVVDLNTMRTTNRYFTKQRAQTKVETLNTEDERRRKAEQIRTTLN